MNTNTLAIIGNGFDRHFGFRTDYSSFYTFLNLVRKKGNDREVLKEFISIDADHTLNDEVNALELIKKIRSHYNSNFFVNYFLSLKEKNITWAGIESELAVIIKIFDDFLSDVTVEQSTGEKIIMKFNSDMTEFFSLMRLVPKCEIYYTRTNDIIIYYKAPSFANNEEILIKNNIIQKFKNDFPDILFKSLLMFEKLFAEYLYCFIPKKIEVEEKIFSIDKDDVESIGLGISDYLEPTKIISYNYTNFCIQNFGYIDESDIKYVHGKIDLTSKNIDEIEQNIIFGIDSKESDNFNNKNFSIFTKKNRRIFYNTDLRTIDSFLDNIQTLIIYGHSLDFADNDSLKYIIEKSCDDYNNYLNSRIEKTDDEFIEFLNEFSIIVYYYDEKDKMKLVNNLERLLGEKLIDLYRKNRLFLYCSQK